MPDSPGSRGRMRPGCRQMEGSTEGRGRRRKRRMRPSDPPSRRENRPCRSRRRPMNETDARLWRPWLRINRVLCVMLHTRSSAEAWARQLGLSQRNDLRPRLRLGVTPVEAAEPGGGIRRDVAVVDGVIQNLTERRSGVGLIGVRWESPLRRSSGRSRDQVNSTRLA
jgi:hypothetical protein